MRRLLRVFGALVVGSLVVAGAACSSSSSRTGPEPVPSSVPGSAPPSTAAPSTTTTIPKGAVTFAFGGDVHFQGQLAAKLAANPATVLAPIAPVLVGADIAMVNLETAITQRGTPEPKQFTFRAPPSALIALASAGIDVATEANNHGVDYGPVGLVDTLAARAAARGVSVIGIGHDADDAYAPYRATINGERVAIIAATQVIDNELITRWTATDTHPGLASAKNLSRLLADVRAARATSDTVLVFLHWGAEGTHCPTPDQQTIAQQLATAGADVIVGSHSHQLEGGGRLGSAFVDYGLGNFAFYTGTATGVLSVTMTGRHLDGYGWQPAVLEGGVPHPVSSPAAVAAWQQLRGCTGLAP